MYTCDHCGKSRTLDGSPVPMDIRPITNAEIAASEPPLTRMTEWWKQKGKLP